MPRSRSGSSWKPGTVGCVATISGSLTSSTPGTYTLQLALDGPLGDFSDPAITQVCFTPTSGGVNQAVLNFTGTGTTGQVLLNTGGFCAPKDVVDLSLPTNFTIPFTVQSGTQDFLGAAGSGTLHGQFPRSILGGQQLTFLTLNNSEFIVPPVTCTDPNGCNGNPNPRATPELDSLVLFGTGRSG